MKKQLVIGSLMMMVLAALPLSVLGALCTDSDGTNFYVKGILTYGTRTYTDKCFGNYLQEYYCKPNGRASFMYSYCKNGCSNGKCNVYTPVCGDGYREYREFYEECDTGINNGIVCSASYGTSCTYCSTSCKLTRVFGSYCGDGVVDSTYEACDDGNNLNGDGCSSSCQTDYCTASDDFGNQQQEIEAYCNTFATQGACTSCEGSQTNCELCKWGSKNEYCRANGDFGGQQQEIEAYCNTFVTPSLCTSCYGSGTQCEFCKWA